jgi:hypothetical protein
MYVLPEDGYGIERHHIPEDRNLYQHCFENLKYDTAWHSSEEDSQCAVHISNK